MIPRGAGAQLSPEGTQEPPRPAGGTWGFLAGTLPGAGTLRLRVPKYEMGAVECCGGRLAVKTGPLRPPPSGTGLAAFPLLECSLSPHPEGAAPSTIVSSLLSDGAFQSLLCLHSLTSSTKQSWGSPRHVPGAPNPECGSHSSRYSRQSIKRFLHCG